MTEVYPYTTLIDGTLAAQGVFSFCFLISAFVVGGNDYAGFIGVLTGLVFVAFIGITYYGIRVNTSRTFYGAILGASLLLTIIALQTAIFWGQYGDCSMPMTVVSPAATTIPASTLAPSMHNPANPPSLRLLLRSSLPQFIGVQPPQLAADISAVTHGRHLYGIECYHTAAMKSVCTFAVFMFLSYMFLLGVLLKFKNDILGSAPLNEGYTSVPQSVPYGDGGAPPSLGSGYPRAATADL